MPTSRPAHSLKLESPYTGLVALIHAHEDRLTPKSKLITFVRAAARNESYDFWWDYNINHPNFNQEILSRLRKADLVVCVLSQGFFDSQYIADVEAKVLKQRIGEGLLVVPVKYSPYVSNPKHYGWLRELHQVPARVESIYGGERQLLLYKEVAEYVQELIRGKSAPFAARESLYAIRQLPDESFSAVEQDRLLADARKRAEHYVPDPNLRQQICNAARALGASLEVPLKKSQLAKLDAKFLAHKEKRNPDPKKIRWVLRAAKLHPQGRAPKVLTVA